MPNWWVMDVHIYSQIFYALHSISGIKNNSKRDNNIGIFFFVQALLTSLGNISKALSGLPEYIDHLGIDTNRIPSVLDRRARNTNEHFEERYLRTVDRIGRVTDLTVGHHKNADTALLRYYNTSTNTIEFVDANFDLQEIRINDIEQELDYLKSAEPIDYIFQRYEGYDRIL